MRSLRQLGRSVWLLAALGVALVGVAAAAEEEKQKQPTVDEIVARANQVAYYQGGTGRATVKLTIKDADGNVRGEREMVILRRNGEGLEQKLYAYILRPADVRGTAFLVWKHTDKDDDRWLYNPGLDLANRIAATDKRTSFVGSHFYYEDVSGRSIADDKHELVKVTNDYYVLKNTPKDTENVEFSYYIMYIHRASFMPTAADYFDKNGEKYREYRVEKMEVIDGFYTATRAVMRDLRERGKDVGPTIAEYSTSAGRRGNT
jgi:hypothetical protein